MVLSKLIEKSAEGNQLSEGVYGRGASIHCTYFSFPLVWTGDAAVLMLRYIATNNHRLSEKTCV